MDDILIKTADSAKFLHTTPQAIHTAVKTGRLPAKKIDRSLFFSKQDLIDYAKSRWRHESYINSLKEGEMSVLDASKRLGVPPNCVYNLLRKRRIRFKKTGNKGSRYILHKDDLDSIREQIRDSMSRRHIGVA